MKMEEINDFDCRGSYTGGSEIVNNDTKRALVGADARILFYPTLLYNVLRNKIHTEFRWWDEVDQAHEIDHLVSSRDQEGEWDHYRERGDRRERGRDRGAGIMIRIEKRGPNIGLDPALRADQSPSQGHDLVHNLKGWMFTSMIT